MESEPLNQTCSSESNHYPRCQRDKARHQGAYATVSMRYRFRLQSVLDLRVEQLDRLRQQLALEEQKRLQWVQRIAEYDELIAEGFRQQQQLLAVSCPDMVSAQQFPHYILRLKQERYQEQLALQAHEKTLRLLREEVKQAMIRKKSLDILKDKGLQKHRKALEKQEEETIADLVMARYHRRDRSLG